jgi:hypothetical protein
VEERKRAQERQRAREREARGDGQIQKESERERERERERAESWCAKRAQAREGLSRGIQPHFHSSAAEPNTTAIGCFTRYF